jgi:hypothetical protein
MGFSLLNQLGINVDSMLAKLAAQGQEWDLSEEIHEDPISNDIGNDQQHRLLRVGETLKIYGCHRAGEIPETHPDFGDVIRDPVPDKGIDTEEEILQALNSVVSKTRDENAPASFVTSLHNLVMRYRDIFRIKQDVRDPPVKVPPMRVTLKPGAAPVRTKTRRQAPLVRDFMRLETDRQLENGLAYLNNESHWTSAPFVVKKKVQEGEPLPELIKLFRMTIDLRKVNEVTEETIWPMPDLEQDLKNLHGAKYFATFDLANGYWQFPLHEDSQEMFSYITDRGVFTPTRVPQGAKGAVAYFQGTMQQILGELMYESYLLWLDDLLCYASTPEGLLTNIEKLFEKCKSFGLKLSAKKCVFYKTHVIWCGREVSAEGVSQDPERLEALRNLATPSKGGELQQFVCAMGWLRMSIPNYAPTVAPLLNFLELVYQKVGSRKKQRVDAADLHSLGWSNTEDLAFHKCQQMLLTATTTAHIDDKKRICVFTDASDLFWGAIVTQIPPEDLTLPLSEQRHEPLAFLSSAFKGAQLNWATVEKEAFSIVETCVRLEYMLLRQGGFHLFTDHRNLTYIFHPTELSPTIQKHTAAKLQRWALVLMGFEYVIEHVPGHDNLWADLLSRWGAKEHTPTTTTPKVRRMYCVPSNAPKHITDFQWPHIDEIQACQNKVTPQMRPPNLVQDENAIWRNTLGKIWIPHTAKDLQMRLCVISHTGAAGHRGFQATLTALADSFWWQNLRSDLLVFHKQCIHCLAVGGPHRIPRPLGEALHADTPGDIIHMDYLFIRRAPESLKKRGKGAGKQVSSVLPISKDGCEYISVLKDDASSFCHLEAVEVPTAETSALHIERWASQFGMPQTWVSDGGSHYKNETLKELRRRYGALHHITLAYCPWSNGTVESFMSQILKVLRALLSEFRMPEAEWTTLLPMVQGALNSAPSPKLGGRSPIEVFTGIKPKRPLDSIRFQKTGKYASLEEVSEKTLEEFRRLEEARDKLHKEVKVTASEARKKSRDRVNNRATIKYPNLMEGDFVMVARETVLANQKLMATWKGPRRITAVRSNWIYEVEDLIEGHRREVHASRIKLYQDKDLEVTEELREQAGFLENSYEVLKFIDLRMNEDTNTMEIKTQWRGFEETEASWEPLLALAEDVGKAIQQYLTSSQGRKQKEAKTAVLLLKQAGHWRN